MYAVQEIRWIVYLDLLATTKVEFLGRKIFLGVFYLTPFRTLCFFQEIPD